MKIYKDKIVYNFQREGRDNWAINAIETKCLLFVGVNNDTIYTRDFATFVADSTYNSPKGWANPESGDVRYSNWRDY